MSDCLSRCQWPRCHFKLIHKRSSLLNDRYVHNIPAPWIFTNAFCQHTNNHGRHGNVSMERYLYSEHPHVLFLCLSEAMPTLQYMFIIDRQHWLKAGYKNNYNTHKHLHQVIISAVCWLKVNNNFLSIIATLFLLIPVPKSCSMNYYEYMVWKKGICLQIPHWTNEHLFMQAH